MDGHKPFIREQERRDARDYERHGGGPVADVSPLDSAGVLQVQVEVLRERVEELREHLSFVGMHAEQERAGAARERERADLAERRLAALTHGARGQRWHVSGRGASLGLGLFAGCEEQDLANDGNAHATAEAASDAIIAAQAQAQAGGGDQ